MKKSNIILLSVLALCGVGAVAYYLTQSTDEYKLNENGVQAQSGDFRVTKLIENGDISTLIIKDSTGKEFTFTYNNQQPNKYMMSLDKGIGAKMNNETKKFDIYNAKEELIGSTQVLTTEEILMLSKIS
jgi:hypothetical protein